MRKTNEDFLSQLENNNPDVEALEPYQSYNTKILFRCRKCNHQWSAKPGHILAGHGCPLCGGSMRLTNEQFVERLKAINPFLESLEPYKNAKTKILCRCLKCNSRITVSPDKMFNQAYQCSECTKRYKTSFPEQSIAYYLSAFFPQSTYVINRFRGIDDISELDIYIPSEKIAIEYDGVYWHSIAKKDKDYKKYAACKAHGIKLIRIVERPKNTDVDQNRIAADLVIVRNAPFIYATLDSCIQELFVKLNYTIEDDFVNTRRDAAHIQSRYFIAIENNSIQSLYPEIAAEWYQPENGSITPNMVLPGSNTPYSWKCSTCGYIWLAAPADRTIQKKGCKRCAIKRLQVKYTKSNDTFIDELSNINPNVLPLEEYQTTHTPIKCKCLICGHEWPASPANLLRGRQCPKCSKQIAAKKISEKRRGKSQIII